MKLSKPQIKMLRRLARREHHYWRMPANGRVAQGWRRTLGSLSRKGLVQWIYSPDSPVAGREGITTEIICPLCGVRTQGSGWCLTEEGVELVKARGLEDPGGLA